MTDSRQSGKHHKPGIEVYWTTVTYRTVLLLVLSAVGILLVGWWLLHPSSFNRVLNSIEEVVAGSPTATPSVNPNQASFVQLEGRVEVRKVGSDWRAADYQMVLDKGDVIKTSSDGYARVSFANGTTYVVKPDTLITVESNTVGQTRAQTRVAVQVRSGAVDLSTTNTGAEVSFEDAIAQVRENSRAAVRTDPNSNQHEITVQSGSADVSRAGQRVQLSQYDRMSFPSGGEITISRVLGPPIPISPLNQEPISAEEPEQLAVEFRWRPVETAVSYHLRVSPSSMFSQLTAERRVTAPGAVISGLKPGDYFWVVTALDAKGGTSEPSETRRFTLYKRGTSEAMLLELHPPRLHGNVVEITGRTEPGATLLIQGQTVPNIGSDGRFQFFTPPLPKGSHRIKVVGQNRRGATAEKPVDVVIP